MKFAVFGGTQGVGLEFVKQALDLDPKPSVRLLARTPSKVPAELRENANAAFTTVVEGDIRNQEAVDRVVEGTNVVILSLGNTKSPQNPDAMRPVDTCSVGTPVVLNAMKKHNVQKLICVTSAGVGDSWADVPWWIKPVIWYFIGAALKDKDIQEQQIKDSGIPFVIVRPGGLQNAPKTGVYRVAEHIAELGRVARADVADLCVKLATDEAEWANWVGKTPTQIA
ncbi:NAD(P)-binding protein [Gonapodya prolifera JEL478]|uniref:NAD(P)-binding protein n=1 Tax=Gonapodya prolifera (strain JEL478) TaxID=1344416 RepID=A0A139AFY8_GONPJ|nr:NAD(P)-binding protein [Gonapodya prolifera JEL478]|eukprot:KXS15707.1 NAD(P)-binding protein [Gonapodya prolifera JEL478]